MSTTPVRASKTLSAKARSVVSHFGKFTGFRRVRADPDMSARIDSLHQEIQCLRVELTAHEEAKRIAPAADEMVALRHDYAVAMTDSLHGPIENIEWLVQHGIDNWSPRYEDMLEFWYSKLIPTTPGMIYDIGAHRGRHTRVFGSLGRQVTAFEPIPHIRELLITSLDGGPGVKIRSEALCNRTGSGRFVVNMHAPEESGIVQRLYNDELNARPTTIDVEYARLDDLHDQSTSISFIKIDTEGGELDILRGAENTLAKHRPIVSVEYGFPGYSRYGHQKRDLLDMTLQLDYAIFDIFGFPIDQANYDNAVDRFGWDYLLIPRERDWLAGCITALRLALASQIDRYIVPAPS